MGRAGRGVSSLPQLPFLPLSTSVEIPNSRAEILSRGDFLEHAGFRLATLLDHIVAPPAQLDLGKLEEEENEDGRDGNGAAEGG